MTGVYIAIGVVCYVAVVLFAVSLVYGGHRYDEEYENYPDIKNKREAGNEQTH